MKQSNAQPYNFSDETHPDFSINPDFINKDGIQFNLLLLDKNKKSLIPAEETRRQYQIIQWLSGLNENSEKAGSYYLLSTKVAFLSPLRTDYYSAERITDPGFIQASMQDYKIEALGANHFKVEGTFFSPSFQFLLKVYNTENQDPEIASILTFLEQHQPNLGRPDKVVVQKNYNYGRVLMHKTTENSMAITLYYPWQNQKTLIVNYTFNLLHNIPPKFLGGPESLQNEMKAGISKIAESHKNTENHRQLTKNNHR
ncbi:MAG: hypothetical protein JJU28_02805 [Cyclobacteriaceae bacterium]|nr:hypothetical protein [Cyclobacteriaceae bacterium]